MGQKSIQTLYLTNTNVNINIIHIIIRMISRSYSGPLTSKAFISRHSSKNIIESEDRQWQYIMRFHSNNSLIITCQFINIFYDHSHFEIFSSLLEDPVADAISPLQAHVHRKVKPRSSQGLSDLEECDASNTNAIICVIYM